jgi:hypothetical protein
MPCRLAHLAGQVGLSALCQNRHRLSVHSDPPAADGLLAEQAVSASVFVRALDQPGPVRPSGISPFELDEGVSLLTAAERAEAQLRSRYPRVRFQAGHPLATHGLRSVIYAYRDGSLLPDHAAEED